MLCCSFGSLCVRFLPPSKTACSSTPVLFSPPSPFCKNDGMHSTCHFMNFVCNVLFSLCISCFTHPFLHLFGEHDFQKCMNVKSCQKQLLSPSNRTDYTYFGAVYGTWNLQNRWEKIYFLLMEPLWKLCLPLCNLPHAFWMTFSHFRLAFAIILRKNATRTRKLIARTCKASTACKVCRIHVAMMTSFWIH